MTSSPDIFAVGIEDELLKPLTSDACLLGASSVATYGESCLEYYPDHAESCSRRSGQCGEDLDDRFVALSIREISPAPPRVFVVVQ